MRDRLIELLEEAHRLWLRYVDECAFNQTPLSFSFEQMFADHLLANGVTILPEGAIILTRAEIDALNKYEERRKQNDKDRKD